MATSKFPGTTQLNSQKIILVSTVTYSEIVGGVPQGLTAYGVTGTGLARVSWWNAGGVSNVIPSYYYDYTVDPGVYYGPIYWTGTQVSSVGLDSASLSIQWRNIGFRVKFNLTFDLYKNGVFQSSAAVAIPTNETDSSAYTITSTGGDVYSVSNVAIVLT